MVGVRVLAWIFAIVLVLDVIAVVALAAGYAACVALWATLAGGKCSVPTLSFILECATGHVLFSGVVLISRVEQEYILANLLIFPIGVLAVVMSPALAFFCAETLLLTPSCDGAGDGGWLDVRVIVPGFVWVDWLCQVIFTVSVLVFEYWHYRLNPDDLPEEAGLTESMPSVSYPELQGSHPRAGQECCICAEPWQHGAAITHTGCGHFFHTQCLQQWLLGSRQCPLCRTDLRQLHAADVEYTSDVSTLSPAPTLP